MMTLAIAEIQKLLSVDAPGYRYACANPQRNSSVPQIVPDKLSVLSRSLYLRFDDQISTRPRHVLCDDNLTLVVGLEELLVFDRYGQVQIMQELHPRGMACLGQEGYAWVTPSGQLSAADANHDLRINRHSLPMFQENCATPLWMPFENGFVSAVQNFGNPFRPEPPPRFYLYSITYEKSFWNWLVEVDGVVQDIFLSNDRSRVILRQGTKVMQYQIDDGTLVGEFDTELVQIHAAVLSVDDKLILLATELEGEVTRPTLIVLTLDGTRVWSTELPEAETRGFLAAGENGFVVVSSGTRLRAMLAGEELYLSELEHPIGPRLTLLKENQVLTIEGKSLDLYAADGSSRTLCDLSDYDDKFMTSPAIAADGRVAIGTDRSLMQLS